MVDLHEGRRARLAVIAADRDLGAIADLGRKKRTATLPAALTIYGQDSGGYGALAGSVGIRAFEVDPLRRYAPKGAVVDTAPRLAGVRLRKSAAAIAICDLALATTAVGVTIDCEARSRTCCSPVMTVINRPTLQDQRTPR